MALHPVETDIWVSQSIVTNGVWEKPSTRIFTKFLEKHQDALFLDIGGNIGYYSHIALANGHQTVAFEPIKSNFRVLCSTINHNKWNDKFTLFNYAISDTPSQVSFHVRPVDQGLAKMVEGEQIIGGEENKDWAYSKVFDSFKIDYDGEIIMKVDIEGHECHLFRGIGDFFKRNTVLVVYMEWIHLSQHGCSKMIAEHLVQNGFEPYEKDGTRKHPMEDFPWTSARQPVSKYIDIAWANAKLGVDPRKYL